VEREIRDRQEIASDYHAGNSLAHILDDHTSEPKYQKIKGEKEWSAMVFTKSPGRPLRCERPCVDDSILWQDPCTKEAIAITYRHSVFEKQMQMYWRLSDD